MDAFDILVQSFISETNVELKQIFHGKINAAISRSTAFAAFKRKIIRDNPDLSAKFAQELL
ncbi:MAG: hypothetical protein LBC02_02490 [Planctomycetaceae bacterium]|jgi:hypothetical protein|nr:hypothetical protein [Planctomycetaceae bacterium]